METVRPEEPAPEDVVDEQISLGAGVSKDRQQHLVLSALRDARANSQLLEYKKFCAQAPQGKRFL